jgi:hypothetical protein
MATPHLRKPWWLGPAVFVLVGLWARPALAAPPTVPTLSEWGTILLVLSLATFAVWRLSGQPALLQAATPGGARMPGRPLAALVLVGQCVAGLGLGLYGALVEPLVTHDVIGALLSGVLLGVLMECFRRRQQLSADAPTFDSRPHLLID